MLYSRFSNNSRASYSRIVVDDSVSRVIRSASYSIILAVFDPARGNNFAASYSRISHGSPLRRELFDNIARLAPSPRVIRSASYSKTLAYFETQISRVIRESTVIGSVEHNYYIQQFFVNGKNVSKFCNSISTT